MSRARRRTVGSPRTSSCTGLKLAGPNFTQQKVIDALNQDTHFDANGIIQPIDWTIAAQRPDRARRHVDRQVPGKWDCASTVQVQNGKFVPVDDAPGKPWVCMSDGPNAPTLTKTPTYESFARRRPDEPGRAPTSDRSIARSDRRARHRFFAA